MRKGFKCANLPTQICALIVLAVFFPYGQKQPPNAIRSIFFFFGKNKKKNIAAFAPLRVVLYKISQHKNRMIASKLFDLRHLANIVLGGY